MLNVQRLQSSASKAIINFVVFRTGLWGLLTTLSIKYWISRRVSGRQEEASCDSYEDGEDSLGIPRNDLLLTAIKVP